MAELGSDGIFAIERASFPVPAKGDLEYVFKLKDGSTTQWFGPAGLTDTGAANTFKVAVKDVKVPKMPTWPEHTVLYQIFPDRFENGDHRNDPKNLAPWNATPTAATFMGGDAAG